MTGKFYNYKPDDLLKEEPEYQVPLSSKLMKIIKSVTIAAIVVILIIKVGIETFEKFGSTKS